MHFSNCLEGGYKLNLFIIGNGFDLEHGLRSSYEDLHNYLIEKYNIDEFDCEPPMIGCDKDGAEIVCESEQARLLCALINNTSPNYLWSDFENDLGKIDFSQCFNDDCFPCYDMSDSLDKQRAHAEPNAEYNAMAVHCALRNLPNIIKGWIEHIIHTDHPQKNDEFAKLINSDYDMFLNFNYTNTLENLYDCKNVCHIHGKFTDENIIIGHGEDSVDYMLDSRLPDIAKITIEDLSRLLRKDIFAAIDRNKDFFEKLRNAKLKNIYSYGFSFNNIDLPYIKEIYEMIDEPYINWCIHDYAKNKKELTEKLEKYTLVIRNCGFKGNATTFHC